MGRLVFEGGTVPGPVLEEDWSHLERKGARTWFKKKKSVAKQLTLLSSPSDESDVHRPLTEGRG